ncbi:MAG: hypothetical protein ACRD3S_03720 [Terracidiphilus sp.]
MAFLVLAPHASAQSNPSITEPCKAHMAPPPGTVRTIFLKNVTEPNDLFDIVTAVRNAIPNMHAFPTQSQNAITLRWTDEDLATAQKLIADLDKPRTLYRLTYTITNYDGDKRLGAEHYVFLALAGRKTVFKQGSRVPILTGMPARESAQQNYEVQYQDIGLMIQATVTASSEAPLLQSKVEQSSLAAEQSATTPTDPSVRQSVVEGFTAVTEGKPAVLGSFEVPGTTHRQEIEVVAESIR